MATLSINKQNQAQVTIPKELIDALQWKSKDVLFFSKAPGKDYIIIEKISREVGKKE
jgi:bifunctional DNA-binding transcriptional regulator/antitoxin component of YhaV-PrlF toxin-antitoxin module